MKSPAYTLAVTPVPFLLLAAGLFWSAAPSAPGKLPMCSAGDRQVVEATGPVTMVQLDGSASWDPQGGQLTYQWDLLCNDPHFWLNDPTSATPILSVEMRNACEQGCNIELTVTNAVGSSSCMTRVAVIDSTAPDIVCPFDTVVPPGEPTGPSRTGFATATDARVANPTIWFSDQMPDPDTIERTWFASDGCVTSSCVQIITIDVGTPPPHVDILPGQCPNEIFFRGASSPELATDVVVTIIGNDLDVTEVVISTVAFARDMESSIKGQFITPISFRYVDNATPFLGSDPCGCHALGGDGILDLEVTFRRSEVAIDLGLEFEPDFTDVDMELAFELLDGRAFVRNDCILVRKN